MIPSTLLWIDELGRPPTLNVERQGNHWARAAKIKPWRVAGRNLWLGASRPLITSPVIVASRPHYADRRARPDVGACLPALKAVIDGLTDAGAWPDDDPDHVQGLILHAPVMASAHGTGLMVWLEEIT